jgi:hypothetical protein
VELQEVLRVVKGDRDRQKVVDSGKHDWIRPRNHWNDDGIEMNLQSRHTRPGGHSSESGGVGSGREHQSDGYSDQRCGGRGRMDGTTSAAHCDSK